MPQTKAQRQYWATRRKNEQAQLNEDTKHITHRGGPVKLVATTVDEYEDIVRIHPGMHVRLDESALQQSQLFDIRGMKE